MHWPFCHQSSHKSPICELKNGIYQRDHCHEDFFNFTRGRFVRNEQQEMAQRSVRFNVRELGRLTATVVGSESCISIEKYPDGMYNKALLMTMNDGAQAVAKIPNPNAGRPHFTTASEVATMEFVGRMSLFAQP